jgi:hypothetical protein
MKLSKNRFLAQSYDFAICVYRPITMMARGFIFLCLYGHKTLYIGSEIYSETMHIEN